MGKVTASCDLKNNVNIPSLKDRMKFYSGFRNNRNVSTSLQITKVK